MFFRPDNPLHEQGRTACSQRCQIKGRQRNRTGGGVQELASQDKTREKSSRLLKNAHLRRCPYPSSLRRTSKYASLLRISGALHLGIFEQPAGNDFFSSPLIRSMLLNNHYRAQIADRKLKIFGDDRIDTLPFSVVNKVTTVTDRPLKNVHLRRSPHPRPVK